MKIICVGKLKEPYLRDALEEYKKRLGKYCKLEIIEIMDSSYREKEKTLKEEGERILKHIQEKEFVITLEVEGMMLDSLSFAENLRQKEQYGPITFVIGGSEGLSNAVKERSNQHLSFSKMTFPHQLFRILLLEQIYRSYKIRNHESYHK